MTREPGTDGQRLLITGAAGRIGVMLRERLARPGRSLRLMDLQPLTADAATHETAHGPDARTAHDTAGDAARETDGKSRQGTETFVGSVTEFDTMVEASRDVDAIVHLAGIPGEMAWPEVLQTNVHGTYCVLEAAHRNGVPRVILASSNHAVGLHSRDSRRDADGVAADLSARPDTYYGWSKAAIEALGRLYADRYSMDVLCLRIGTCMDRPRDVRALSTWLSPDDCARLVEACLSAPRPGFRLVWGVSANTRRWWSLEAGREIGYEPVDDAERYAAELVAEHGEPDLDDPLHHLVGGEFGALPLGGG